MKKFINYIDNDNNERIKEVLKTLNDNMNIYDLLYALNKMYEKYGNENVKKVREMVLIRCGKLYGNKWDLQSIDSILYKVLETESHDVKLHYRTKVVACLYEMIVAKRENNQATDKKTDKNGWDIVNHVDKVLYQVKYGNDLMLKHSQKHIKWAQKNGYKGYKLKVLWYNTNNKTEVEIDLQGE